MSTIRFTDTQLISLIRIHTYMHMHTGGRWWQRAVMAYFVLNIQLGPVLDEDLHHLQMACISGPRKRGPSPLSETDTHSERDTTACHHTLPTYRQLSIYKHTYICTYIQYVYIQRLLRIHMLLHTYIHYGHPCRLRIQRYIALTYRTRTYIDTDKHPNE